jgi:hypothetical protein
LVGGGVGFKSKSSFASIKADNADEATGIQMFLVQQNLPQL